MNIHTQNEIQTQPMDISQDLDTIDAPLSPHVLRSHIQRGNAIQ